MDPRADIHRLGRILQNALLSIPTLPVFSGLGLGLLIAVSPITLSSASGDDGLLPLPQDLPKHFGVIGIRLQGAGQRLRVTHVRVGSPADSAGVRVDDLLRGADTYRLTSVQETLDYMQSLPPDSSVVLHLQRQGEDLHLSCGLTDRRRLYGLMIELDRPPPGLKTRHHQWLNETDTPRAAMDLLVDELDAAQDVEDLRAALARDAIAYGHDGRLADVDFALHHPLAAGAPVRSLADEIREATTVQRIDAMARRLDVSLGEPPDPVAAGPDTVFVAIESAELHDALLSRLWLAGQLASHALPEAGAPASLVDDVASLIDRFDESFYLDEGDRDETIRHSQTLRWARQVDVGSMAAALSELGRLGEPAHLRAIAKAAAATPRQVDSRLPGTFTGDIRLAQLTEWGWLVIGGKGRNVYGEDAAVIIDLGGDDLYLGGGRAVPGESPIGLIIDLGGDDRYVDRRVVGAGGAIAGVAAIIDTKGDDLYEGGALNQASAFAGAALLLDLDGNDTYFGDVMTQGAAMFGVALLVDAEGRDLYSAAQIAQGFAGPGGVAAIVDISGRDRYVADRSRPSGYGTQGVYKGWSQGVGCGLRGYAAGGFGLLLDTSGDDEYRGGNFSQGVGYFFGLGGLVDMKGDDRYHATRYSQGSAAHQAAGVLIDVTGDDVYEGRIAANQGAAWDASVALLIDHAGDDDYNGAGLAQGAAAMNGFAALIDGRGDDRYRSPSGQADGGSTRYWGGRDAPNIAILIDGEGRDTYDREGRADGIRLRRSQIGLFHDLE